MPRRARCEVPSSVRACDTPEAYILAGDWTPTKISLFFPTYRGGSHLRSGYKRVWRTVIRFSSDFRSGGMLLRRSSTRFWRLRIYPGKELSCLPHPGGRSRTCVNDKNPASRPDFYHLSGGCRINYCDSPFLINFYCIVRVFTVVSLVSSLLNYLSVNYLRCHKNTYLTGSP